MEKNNQNIDHKKNIIYYGTFSIISKIITYVILLVFANLYLPSDYGEARFYLSIYYLITALLFFGLPQSIVPFYHKDRTKMSSIFTSYLVLIIIASLIGIGLFWNKPALLALDLSMLFYFLVFFFSGLLQAEHKHGMYQFFFTLMQAFILALSFLFVGKSSGGIIYCFALSYIAGGLIISAIYLKRFYSLIDFRIDYPFLLEYAKYSIVFVVIGYSFMILSWIDSSILGWLGTFDDVAVYNVASQLAFVITLIPISISMFLLTRVSSSKDENISMGVLKRSLRISFFLSMICAIILASLIGIITKIFFPVYHGKIELLFMMLLIGLASYCIYYLIYTYYAGKLQPGKVLVPIVFGTFVNVILDIMLIPKFGVYGVVFATLLAHLICFTLLLSNAGLLKGFWIAYILLLFVPLSYYLRYYGLLTLIFAVPLFFVFKLIETEDIKIVVDTLKSFARR